MIGNYADPTRASKSCVEAITRGMGATEDGESFHDIVSVFDREMSKNGLSPHDTESELLVATHFPSAELILQPHFARVDLLLSAPSLAASLTSR